MGGIGGIVGGTQRTDRSIGGIGSMHRTDRGLFDDGAENIGDSVRIRSRGRSLI